MSKKIQKFSEPLTFRAKSEKFGLLREYCIEHNIDLLFVAENIREEESSKFDKFLVDNKILSETVTTNIPVPSKNHVLLQELRTFADQNNFKIKISGNCASCVVPVDIYDSNEFTNLLIKLEKSFNEEMEVET